MQEDFRGSLPRRLVGRRHRLIRVLPRLLLSGAGHPHRRPPLPYGLQQGEGRSGDRRLPPKNRCSEYRLVILQDYVPFDCRRSVCCLYDLNISCCSISSDILYSSTEPQEPSPSRTNAATTPVSGLRKMCYPPTHPPASIMYRIATAVVYYAYSSSTYSDSPTHLPFTEAQQHAQ